MLSVLKARPMILVAAGLLWMSAFLLAAGAGVPPLTGDFGRGLGMGVGIGLEILGLVLLTRQKRRRGVLADATRRL